MNFKILIFLLSALETVTALPVRLIKPAIRPVNDDLHRSSRDLIHWNRVTNNFNRYE